MVEIKIMNHHLLLNGLPEPPHRRSLAPVARGFKALRVSETRGHQLNISLRFISISISHSVKRSQKSMNMSATNDYEGRNSPRYGPLALMYSLSFNFHPTRCDRWVCDLWYYVSNLYIL